MHTTVVNPGLFKSNETPIHITSCSVNDIENGALDALLCVALKGGVVGVAASFARNCVLDTLALAAEDKVLKLSMRKHTRSEKKRKSSQQTGSQCLQAKLLTYSGLDKLGFDMDKISTALYTDSRLRISPAIDVQTLHSSARRHSNALFFTILGGETTLHRDNVIRVLRDADDGVVSDAEDVARRAWASWKVSTLPWYPARRTVARTICTDMIPSANLDVISKCIRDSARLHNLKPSKVKNDVKAEISLDKHGNLQVQLERYNTRIRSSHNQSIVIQTSSRGTKPNTVKGRTINVKGKSAIVKVDARVSGKIQSVHTIGKDLTPAEIERTGIILDALHRTSTLLSQPLVRQIFFDKPATKGLARTANSRLSNIFYDNRPLNPSQTMAVEQVLSDDPKDRIVLIQGPPGTGKTTVIAACVKSLILNPVYKEKRTIWLLAQSNVAVKNIAEKLADVGFFNFKLLVSNEFHFEWHEHLYVKISRNIIVSDSFSGSGSINRRLLDCRVILCTMSMLSHPSLMSTGITRLIPLETVLVDEASQIEIGDYLPMLSKFEREIKKLAFIGDDKQLAPYGSEEIRNLRSIFEVSRLCAGAVFLGRQYRMPGAIGDFVSRKVYGGRLGTEHNIDSMSSARFVDVRPGQEVMRSGSFQNDKEVIAVLHIVRRFTKEGKSFRIITPYDGQRALLEKKLKETNLPWENKVFSVDSFQGNEDDHIIISVVRSAKVGFLNNLRRSNVMLSRCKKSMTICTSRAYLSGIAKDTLLGELAAEWGADAWIEWGDLLTGSW